MMPTTPVPRTPASPSVTTTTTTGAKMFTAVCPLPFAGALNPPADDHCGIQGGSSDPAKQAESRAKNNFCAPAQSPPVLTHQFLAALQAKPTGMNLPKSLADRSQLEGMGE